MRNTVLRAVLVTGVISLLNQLIAGTLPALPGLVVPALAVAAAGCYAIVGFARRASAARGRYRFGWASAAASAGAMALSYLLFGVFALFGVAPEDSPDSLFSVTAGLLSIAGVLALAPRLQDRSSRATHLLDVAGLATGMFAVTLPPRPAWSSWPAAGSSPRPTTTAGGRSRVSGPRCPACRPSR